QFVVSAPKAQPVTSKLLGQRLQFAFEPDEYARSLPDMRAKQAYLRQLKETNEAAYIRYDWPGGVAEYVLFVKPVRLPDGALIYGMNTHDRQPVRPLVQLPMIGSKRPDIKSKHSPYALTVETLRSLAPGAPTRFVEPLERAYDTRFPPLAEADWNVLTNGEGMIIAAVRPYGEQWRRAIYQYGTKVLVGHPPAHWPTMLSVLEGKTVLSLRSGLNIDEVMEQESKTPQPAGGTRLYTSCYIGPCSFVLAEDEGFIFCFVDDDEPLTVPVPDRHLSLVDWIGTGSAVLTPTQVEAREILRRRHLSKKEQVGLPAVATLARLSHSGSQETMSQRFAQVIAEYGIRRRAEESTT
ncbi:MAG: hypothetical protein OEU26_11325, partial [Candidatus Tectomicrobia bacterium]|nr:hypothetical protein [Candidatus Tectomicrobia bacterium]